MAEEEEEEECELDRALRSKAAGNDAYASGDCARAIALYGAALGSVERALTELKEENVELSLSSLNRASKEAVDLQGVLLTNRAMCYLKLGEYEKCVFDCDEALALDGGRVKALYRRAKARSELGADLELAFEDATRCVKLGAGDGAVELARSLKAKLSKTLEESGAYESPAAQLACRIANGDNERWAQAAAMAAADEANAKLMWSKGACAAAMAMTPTDPGAARLVAACCVYKNVEVDVSALTTWVEGVGPIGDEIALLTASARLAQEANRNPQGESLHSALSRVASAAMQHRDHSVRDAAMELLVKWLAPSTEAHSTTGASGLNKKSEREQRERLKVEREARRATLARRLAKETTMLAKAEPPKAWCVGLWRLLAVPQAAERRKAQAAFARLLRAVAKPAALEKGYDLEYELLLDGAHERNECGPADLVLYLLQITVEDTDEKDLADRKRRASLACACHLASTRFSSKAIEACFAEPAADILRLVHISSDETAQVLGADALSCLASSEEGRFTLQPLVASGALEALMEAKELPKVVRSAAATAVAKLGLTARALKAGAEATGRLLDAAVALLRDEDDSSSEAKEQAVEVLAAMSGASHVKEEIAHGSGRVAGNALDALCKLEVHGDNPVAFALASLLASVTVTNNEMRQRHFREREMEITPEQYDELQRITKQKADDDADNDTDELCHKRCRKLVMCDGVAAVARIARTNPSKPTAEKLSAILVHLAKDEALRGTLIQQGGFKAAVDLAASEDSTETCRLDAAHAAAKILVTTNPHVLTDAQRLSAVRPLVWLCRQYKALELMHFEACLALTNLGSLGSAAKRRIACEKGIPALEYLQFSDNEMVQRAATEALCNMVPDPDFLAQLKKPDKLKLWFALSLEYDKDIALARAAIGCLAMASACFDEDMPAHMTSTSNCIDALAELLKKFEHHDLIHRAAFCVANLARRQQSRTVLLNSDIPKLVRAAANSLVNVDDYALLDALTDAINALKREPVANPVAPTVSSAEVHDHNYDEYETDDRESHDDHSASDTPMQHPSDQPPTDAPHLSTKATDDTPPGRQSQPAGCDTHQAGTQSQAAT